MILAASFSGCRIEEMSRKKTYFYEESLPKEKRAARGNRLLQEGAEAASYPSALATQVHPVSA